MLAGLVLDDPAYLLCGILFLVLPLLAGITFFVQEKKVLASVVLSRSTDRLIISEGTASDITLAVSAELPAGMQAGIREILPARVVYEHPQNDISLTGVQMVTASYRAVYLTHGNFRFPGIDFEVCNPYYTSQHRLTAAQFTGPEIHVQPVPYFEKAKKAGPGEREIDRARVYKGLEIRSFRNYVAGDDLRFIDWKLSAKHGKFIVREYSGLEKRPGIVVLDLPDLSCDIDPDSLKGMIRHATGKITRELETTGAVSVVLISGINSISVLPYETERMRCIEFLRDQAHPVKRLYYASSIHTRSENRSYKQSVEREISRRSPGPLQQYLTHIGSLLTNNIPQYRNPGFYQDCVKLLVRSQKPGGMDIYSSFFGDTSHIRILLSLAGRENIPARVYVSEKSGDVFWRTKGARNRGVPVEVIS